MRLSNGKRPGLASIVLVAKQQRVMTPLTGLTDFHTLGRPSLIGHITYSLSRWRDRKPAPQSSVMQLHERAAECRPALDVGVLAWRGNAICVESADVREEKPRSIWPPVGRSVGSSRRCLCRSLTSVSSLMTVGRCLLNNVVWPAMLEDVSREHTHTRTYINVRT